MEVDIDPAFADLIPAVLARCRRACEELAAAVEATNATAAECAGHALAGLGGGYGFHEISRIGAAVEDAARAGNWSGLRSLGAQATRYLDSVRPRIGGGGA